MDDRLTGRPVPDDTTDDDPSRVAMAGDGVAHGAVDEAPADVVAGPPTDHAGNAPADRDDHPDLGAAAEPGDQPGAFGSTGPGDQPGTSGSTGPGDEPGVRGQTGPGEQPRAGAPADAEADNGGPAPDEDEARPAKSRSHRSLWRELPLLVLLALVIALVIKTFVVQAFFIPSGSMENTLEIGDKILVNKLVYHFRSIQPGDIIVFDGAGSWNPVPPQSRPSSDPLVRAYDATINPLLHAIAGVFGTAPGQTDYIKRVIGVPGDKVVCCNAQGLITVNGVPLHEASYLFPGEAPSDAPAGYSGRFSITVPAGRLWVMGDNRAVSDDSRLRQNDPGHGTIPENEVIGRAFMIVWPANRWRILGIPSTFLQHGITASAAAGPLVPLASGFAVAVPLTWLRRRLRGRGRRRTGSLGR
jgi:signal peptidase I